MERNEEETERERFPWELRRSGKKLLNISKQMFSSCVLVPLLAKDMARSQHEGFIGPLRTGVGGGGGLRRRPPPPASGPAVEPLKGKICSRHRSVW